MTPEMKKMMEELEKLMAEVDKEKIQEKMNEMKFDKKHQQHHISNTNHLKKRSYNYGNSNNNNNIKNKESNITTIA